MNRTNVRLDSDAITRADPRAFQRLLESLPIISYVIVVDRTRGPGHVKYISPQVETILGYSPEEWKADPRFWIDHVHPDDRDYVAEALERGNQSEEPLSGLEYRFLTSNGRVRWFRSDQIIQKRSLDELRIHGVMVDITAEKAAERALIEREHHMRTVFENANDIIARFDRDLRHLFVNEASERITNLPAREHVGKTHRELGIDEALSDLWEESLQAVFESGSDQSLEFSVESPDGVSWYHTRLVPELDRSGHPETVLAITHDISPVIEAQRALWESEKMLQLIVDHAPEAIVLYDVDQGTFIDVNQNAIEMFGYSRSELLQMAPIDLSPAIQPDGTESAAAASGAISNALEGESELFNWTHLDRLGNEVLCEIRLIRFPDPNRRLLRGSILDISDRAKAEALKKSTEEHYRQLFESIPIGLYRTTPEGKILEVNREMVRLLGYPDAETLRTQQVTDVQVHSNARGEWARAVENAIDTYVQETRLKRYDGSLVTVREISRAVRDAFGKVIYYEGSMEDITERKIALEKLRLSEERYRSLFEGVPIGLYRTDPGGRILDLNDILVRLLGYQDKTSLVGLTAQDLFGNQAGAEWLRDLQLNGQIRNRELRVTRADENPIWVRTTAKLIRTKRGAIQHIEASMEDITESVAAREEIVRLAAFPTQNPEPVLACDLSGAITYSNPAALELKSRFGADHLQELLPEDHNELIARAEERGSRVQSGERVIGDRALRWLYYPQPEAGVLHLYCQDITEQKQVEERLLHHAFHDPLTGLANRALFVDRLDQAVNRARRHAHYNFAVLFMDLDRFKLVNDSLGHVVGDELLEAVGGRLRSCVRAVDTVARLGGDEFGVLLEEIRGSVDATRVATRIHESLAREFTLSDHEIFTSASIGIALGSQGYSGAEEVIRDSDIAMYRAKNTHSPYVIFDRSMHEQAVAALKLETDLRLALSAREFFLEFQPVFSIPDQKIVGFEALLRWHHPELGILYPGDFCSMAEESGLGGALTELIVTETCRHTASWKAALPSQSLPPVSINIASAVALNPSFVESLSARLKTMEFDPGHLILEIPEQTMIGVASSNHSTLQALKDLGIRLHVDEFGAGLSSLRTLHTLPIDALKIDRSYMSGLQDGSVSEEIIQSIHRLADSLQIVVIASGVETEEQFQRLAGLGTHYAQGDFFHKPVAGQAVPGLLTS